MQIVAGRFSMPQSFSPAAADLVGGLLQRDPARRLGAGPGGMAQLKRHPFFAEVDWAAMEAREVVPFIMPK